MRIFCLLFVLALLSGCGRSSSVSPVSDQVYPQNYHVQSGEIELSV